MNNNPCPGCAEPLPADALCSISQTINPGEKLCSDCGQKETMDALWADGRRIGWERHKAAMESMDVVRDKLKGGDA